MNLRLSDIKDELILRYNDYDYTVEDDRNIFLRVTNATSKKTYIIDNRDHTGPILLKSFREWVDQFAGDDRLILITTGFYHRDVKMYLIKGGFVGRVALLQFGLKSIYDDELHTEIFGDTSNQVFEILHDVVGDEMGVEIESETCDYCERGKVSYCVDCGSRLCSEHFIPCPLCREKLCHPDSGERCYYEHNC